MTTPQEAERRFSQMRHDVDDVYDLLTTVESTQKKHGEQLETLAADVGTLKTDVGTLKTDVGTLKTDVGTLKDVQAKQGEKLDQILALLGGQPKS